MTKPVRNYVYDATCDRDVDGDTVVLDVDLGGHVHAHWQVRLVGIDAPSHKSTEGVKSIADIKALLFDAAGKPVPLVIQTTKDKDDIYGRYLARIWLPDGTEVGPAMVAHHDAVAWDGKGGHPAQAGGEVSVQHGVADTVQPS